jgi:formylmethanofuran dehydrogenase subunit E
MTDIQTIVAEMRCTECKRILYDEEDELILGERVCDNCFNAWEAELDDYEGFHGQD